jgi:hypothetical protein
MHACRQLALMMHAINRMIVAGVYVKQHVALNQAELSAWHGGGAVCNVAGPAAGLAASDCWQASFPISAEWRGQAERGAWRAEEFELSDAGRIYASRRSTIAAHIINY